jgi:hypothetical protein
MCEGVCPVFPPHYVEQWLARAAGALVALSRVFLPLEVWKRHRASALDRRSVLEVLASARFSVPHHLLGGVVLVFITVLWGGTATLVPLSSSSTWWTALACLPLLGLLYCWDYRCAHHFRPSWAMGHSVHLSSPRNTWAVRTLEVGCWCRVARCADVEGVRAPVLRNARKAPAPMQGTLATARVVGSGNIFVVKSVRTALP